MNNKFFYFLLVTFLLFFYSSTVWAQKRVALVVGNQSYQQKPLESPEKDAKVIASLLHSYGFDVILKTNLGFEDMGKLSSKFYKEMSSLGADVALFYYSGHASQYQGRNYLLPVDRNIDYAFQLSARSLDLGEILQSMAEAGVPLKIAILDACRDRPVNKSKGSSKGLNASQKVPDGMLLAYATAPGEIANDGTINGNSPYTQILIKQLALNPDLPLENVLKKVNKVLRKKTGNMQKPWYNSSLSGDFCLSGNCTLFKKRKQIGTQDVESFETGNKTRKDLKIEMIDIPGGCFTIGWSKDWNGRARYRNCLNAFKIGKYEVTQSQWKEVMGVNPSLTYKHGKCTEPDCPVENVSYEDIQIFLKNLNQGRRHKFRLPTEAEWEYACRHGGASMEYCTGNDRGEFKWSAENAEATGIYSYTHPVGKTGSSNGIGIFDMSGNVWEWTCSEIAQSKEGHIIYNGRNEMTCTDKGKRYAVRGGTRLMRMSGSLESRGMPGKKGRIADVGLRLAQDSF